MRLFLLEKNKVVPNPSTLLIDSFKELWKRDTSKDKSQALLELAYVYYISDYKSVYLSVPPEDREQVIIDDLFSDNKYWKADKEVLAAVKKYQELQHVPALRFLDAQRHALEELMKYYKNVDHRRITRPTEISKAMAESAKVLDSLDKIEERVKKEISTKGKLRGENKLGSFEDPEDLE